MKAIVSILVCTGLLMSAGAVLAAKPTAIQFQSKGLATDGQAYENYLVRCSNNSERLLVHWKDGKEWCVEGVESAACESRKIKAMQKACKLPSVGLEDKSGQLSSR